MDTYTLKELVAELRLRHGLTSLSPSVTVTGQSESRTDALCEAHLRRWYEHILLHGQRGTVPEANLCDDPGVRLYNYGSHLMVVLPPRGRRLYQVRLDCWPCAVDDFLDPADWGYKRQRDPMLRATVRHPIAVLKGRVLRLFGLDGSRTPRITELIMSTPPDDPNLFTFHPIHQLPDLKC